MANKGNTAIAGKDVLVLNDNIFTGLADADAIKIDPQGDIAEYKVSKDGNTIIALKNSGILVVVTIRLVRACFDDTFLNGLLSEWRSNPAGFALMSGSYLKRIGRGDGTIVNEIYQLAAGTFKAIPRAASNTDGSVEQNVSEYTLYFRNDARLMQ